MYISVFIHPFNEKDSPYLAKGSRFEVCSLKGFPSIKNKHTTFLDHPLGHEIMAVLKMMVIISCLWRYCSL
jgi:hypothetical protein